MIIRYIALIQIYTQLGNWIFPPSVDDHPVSEINWDTGYRLGGHQPRFPQLADDGNNRKPLDTVYSDFFQLPPNGFGPPRFRKPLKHRLSIYLIETPRPLEKRT